MYRRISRQFTDISQTFHIQILLNSKLEEVIGQDLSPRYMQPRRPRVPMESPPPLRTVCVCVLLSQIWLYWGPQSIQNGQLNTAESK